MNLKIRLGFMIGLPCTFAALSACLIYAERRGVFDSSISPDTAITISTNVSQQLQEASLHLAIFESTPYESHWYASRNLGSPVGRGEVEDGTNYSFHEERLMAITQDGFEMCFTKKQCPSVETSNLYHHQIEKMIIQTNIVLFNFGKTTETNTLGWKIIGKFE